MQVCDYCHALSASFRPSRNINDDLQKTPTWPGFFVTADFVAADFVTADSVTNCGMAFQDCNIAHAATVSATCL
jgi:hypothetical protein